jgi:hypothetical protein
VRLFEYGNSQIGTSERLNFPVNARSRRAPAAQPDVVPEGDELPPNWAMIERT